MYKRTIKLILFLSGVFLFSPNLAIAKEVFELIQDINPGSKDSLYGEIISFNGKSYGSVSVESDNFYSLWEFKNLSANVSNLLPNGNNQNLAFRRQVPFFSNHTAAYFYDIYREIGLSDPEGFDYRYSKEHGLTQIGYDGQFTADFGYKDTTDKTYFFTTSREGILPSTPETCLRVFDYNSNSRTTLLCPVSPRTTQLVEFDATYFNTSSDEIWKTDGTKNGTQLAIKLPTQSGRNTIFITEMVVSNGKLFIFAIDGVEEFLYISDGTQAGTNEVKRFPNTEYINTTCQSCDKTTLDVYGSRQLLFSAPNGLMGQGLWVSDGSNAGTQFLKDLSSTDTDGTILEFLYTDDARIFFVSQYGNFSNRLWQTDATGQGTKLLVTQSSGEISPKAIINNFLYYTTIASNSATKLWKLSLETGDKTQLRNDIDFEYFNPEGLFGVYYFAGRTDQHGLEPWRFYYTAFDDVTPETGFLQDINTFSSAGITGGCATNPARYCPGQLVTRAQMAVFLLRGIQGSDYLPPPAAGDVFADVSASSFAAAWIEDFYRLGITQGCSSVSLNYCPTAPVTRAQMAVFMLRAKYGAAYQPPLATGTMFNDVALGSFADGWIEQLSREGITGGCGGGNFCPDANVTRGQMAAFLVRLFGL